LSEKLEAGEDVTAVTLTSGESFAAKKDSFTQETLF